MASGSGRPNLVQAVIGCLGCFIFYHYMNWIGVEWFAPVLLLVAGIIIVAFLMGLVGQWRMHRAINDLIQPTGLYGHGIIAGEQDCHTYGLTKPLDGSRIFLGGLGQTILTYDGVSHLLTIAPNAAGKTQSLSITNNLAITHNTISTDKGGEVAQRCFHYRRDVLGHETIAINPWGLGAVQGIPNHEFNPAGIFVKLARRNDPTLIDEIRKHRLVLIPDTKGDNSFFTKAAGDLCVNLMFHFAYWEAETGELVCNYPHLHSMVAGSNETLKTTLLQMTRSDVCDGVVAESARDLLGLMKDNPKTFESIKREAGNHLSIFDKRGILAKSCELSDFDPDDLKRKKMSIFIMAPPENINGPYGAWMGLVVNTLISVIMSARTMHPRCTLILDEFSNLSTGALPAVIPALYVGRSYGCQLWCMIQNKASLRRYGDEHTAFESQSEIVNCWGIRLPEDAEWVEKKSAQWSAITEGSSLPVVGETAASDGRYSITISEKAVPVIRKDQAMQLPDYTQIIFFKNKPVIVADLVSFRAVDPWRAQVTTLPGDEHEPDLPVRFQLS